MTLLISPTLQDVYSEKIAGCLFREAVSQRCSVKKVLLEISQNLQENTCARVSEAEACNFSKKETLAQVFSCEFCEISKNTFSYRTTLVAASVFKTCYITLRSN